MRVSHYFELEGSITGGIATSVEQQRKSLKDRVELTEEPSLETDILHLNTPGPRSAYYAMRARRNGVSVVVHSHVTVEEWEGSFRFLKHLRWPLEKWLNFFYPLADVLVCPSEHNRERIERHAPDTWKKVLTNGVDLDRLSGQRELRDEYLERYDLEPPVVFCVGHVMKRKGLCEFVEAAERNPELDFCWFGYMNRRLKDRETLRLVDGSPENCVFTGYVEDIRGAYAAGDIFFYPTREDNEGISVLEAMATGKAVLLRDIELFERFVEAKECLKFEGNPDTELKRLAEDEKLRNRLGNNSSRRIREEFSLEYVGEELEKLYRSVLQ